MLLFLDGVYVVGADGEVEWFRRIGKINPHIVRRNRLLACTRQRSVVDLVYQPSGSGRHSCVCVANS